MRTRILFSLAMVAIALSLNAQCWVPDATYCYDNNLTDVVAFEICDGANAVSAEIFQGEFELGFDDLKVYDGATGSGTGGTLIFGPTSGNLQGTTVGPSTAGNCLIFVVSSGGSNSCANQGGSPEPFKELHVFQNSLPTYDVNGHCYGDGETDAQIAELCPDPGNTIQIEICKGGYEFLFDDFTIYEGAMGTGTGGTIIFGPTSGDLTGNIVGTNTAGNCLTLISNSNGGGESCAGPSNPGTQDPLYAHTLQALPIGLFNFNGISERDHNALSWKTRFEINNEVQILQKSLNGFSDWEEVSAKQEMDVYDEVKTYYVKDRDLAPRTYYRIYSRDYDGFEQYSSSVVITRDDTPSKMHVVQQFPNPAYDFTYIELKYDALSDINVSIVSINGQVLRSTVHKMGKGINHLEVNLSGLPAGSYYLNLSNEIVNKTLKVIKI